MITTCRSDHHPPIHVLHTLLPAVALVPRAAWALCGNSSARRSEIIRESARESTSDTTARLPGTLAELEAVVAAVEQTPSLISAADQLRPDETELPGVLRWLRRRVRLVHNALRHVLGLLPDQFAGCRPDVAAFRQRLDTTTALLELREVTAPWLSTLPAPLGFRPHRIGAGNQKSAFQQPQGPGPPPLAR